MNPGRKKGTPKTGGRTKGTPNKLTVSARDAFQSAFDTIGGAERLGKWAEENETEFFKLFARLIPQDVAVSGHISQTIEHESVLETDRRIEELFAGREARDATQTLPH